MSPKQCFSLFWRTLIAFTVLAFVGVLLFAILLDPNWSRSLFGGDFGGRLHLRAVLFMLEIRAPDRNANAIPDWCEWMHGRHYDAGPLGPASAGTRFHEGFHVYHGERTRIQARMYFMRIGGVWPHGLRALVAADKPVLFTPGGSGPATTGPFELVVSPSGTLDFDVLVPDDIPDVIVNLVDIRSGRSLCGDAAFDGPPFTNEYSIVRCLGKRLPAIDCRPVPDSPHEPSGGWGTTFEWDKVDLATHYFVEMAFPRKPEVWYPVSLEQHRTLTHFRLEPALQKILGQPIFRVIPSIDKPRHKE